MKESCTSVHAHLFMYWNTCYCSYLHPPASGKKKKNLVPSKEEERGIQEGLLKGFRSSPGVR